MTRIAIASNSDNLKGQIAHSPGHCPYFCILSETENIRFIENPAYHADKAFGSIASEYLEKENIQMVIAGFFGPRFQEIAMQNGMQLLSPPPSMHSISTIIEYINKKIMPNLNHKGPEGEGPRTGQNQGKCNPENKGLSEEEILSKKSHSGQGRMRSDGKGMGRGKGLGRGMGAGKGRNRN